MAYHIERLSRTHGRKAFSSGIQTLDDYLRYYALQNDKKRIASAYVALDGEKVVGYYTLSNASITLSDLRQVLAEKLPAYPIPAIRVGKFAIDQPVQGQGIGGDLLSDSLLRCVEASKISAVFAIIVDAKEQSIDFYKKYGFLQSRQEPRLLFIQIETIIKALN